MPYPVLHPDLSFPPFGYLLTINSTPPDPQLFEISHFARFEYQEFAVMELRLPTLETHLMNPGDYRTKPEIYRDAAEPSYKK